MLAALADRGWRPDARVVDNDRPALVENALHGTAGLVALRPATTVAGRPGLAWRPIEGGGPRERFALAATRTSPHHATVDLARRH